MTVTVLQVSDTHLRADPEYRHPALGSPDEGVGATITVVDIDPDVVVLSGDLADDGSPEALTRVRAAVEPFDAPLLAVAGNHDLQRSVDAVFGPPRPLDAGGWRILPVPTVVEGREDGAVDVAALVEHVDALDPRPTVLVMHHPPLSPSTHAVFALDGHEELLAELRRRPHVRLILTGHLHQTFELTDGALTVLGAPSTFYAMHHDGPTFRLAPDAPVGARVVELHADGTFAHRLVIRTA